MGCLNVENGMMPFMDKTSKENDCYSNPKRKISTSNKELTLASRSCRNLWNTSGTHFIYFASILFHWLWSNSTKKNNNNNNKQKPLLLKMFLLLCNMHHPSKIYMIQENSTNLQFFSHPQPLKVVASYQLVMILLQLVVLLQFLLPS